MCAMKPPVILTISTKSPGLHHTLASLSEADVPTGVPLILVVEESETAASDLMSASKRFWSHGAVTVRVATDLSASDIACSLANEHGAVIILSDDLVVSRQFYHYAQQATAEYAIDDQIASISLFALGSNRRTRQPFIPLPDRGDTFFVRTSSPAGVILTDSQCNAFREWREASSEETDWCTFQEVTHRFTVFPRSSLATAAPVGDPYKSAWRRVPLNQFKCQFALMTLAESVAVYDSHFEMLPDRLNRLTDQFEGLSYGLDLYATRDLSLLTEPHVITTRRCESSIRGFMRTMRPMEANLIARLPGSEILLAPTASVDRTMRAAADAQRQNTTYFGRGQITGGRRLFALKAAGWVQSVKTSRDRSRG